MDNVTWRKATRSDANGGNCVEVASLPRETIGLRDSKNPDGGHLTVTPAAFGALLAAIRADKHTL